MTIEQIIRAIQSREQVTVDGKAGPQTWLAIYSHYFPASPKPAPIPEGGIAMVDARSENAIATLHPQVRPLARALVQAAAAQGILIKITSGTRTYEEQEALYAEGRTKPGNIVTNARGGQSNHNHGIAFDVTIFDGSKPVWESPTYKAVGSLGKSLGLDWGGDWQSINDEPHFELRPSWATNMSETAMLSELRRRHEMGKDQFA